MFQTQPDTLEILRFAEVNLNENQPYCLVISHPRIILETNPKKRFENKFCRSSPFHQILREFVREGILMYVNDLNPQMMKVPDFTEDEKYLNLYYTIKKTSRQCFIHTKTPSLNATCSASPEGTGRRPIVHLSSQDA